jgi:threonine synthase
MKFVTHLECANCGQRYEAGKIHNLCTSCQRPLWVRYDLNALRQKFTKKQLLGRPPTLWRYLEMLPISNPDSIVSLSETITPILETKRLAVVWGKEPFHQGRESIADRELQSAGHGDGDFDGEGVGH